MSERARESAEERHRRQREREREGVYASTGAGRYGRDERGRDDRGRDDRSGGSRRDERYGSGGSRDRDRYDRWAAGQVFVSQLPVGPAAVQMAAPTSLHGAQPSIAC